jgi:hypothetical protein
MKMFSIPELQSTSTTNFGFLCNDLDKVCNLVTHCVWGLECFPKTHVLKTLSPPWHNGEVVGPLRPNSRSSDW